MTSLMAFLILLPSSVTAVWSFRSIVRRYRVASGFPWIPSLLFAAAAMTAVFALNVLIGS